MFLHPCVREKRLRQLSNHPVLKPQFNIGALAPRPRPPSHHSAGWYIREGGRLKHLNSVPDDAERLILPKLTPGWPRNLTGRARSAPLRGWNVQSCSGESRLSPYTDDDPPLQKLFATLCGRSPGRSRASARGEASDESGRDLAQGLSPISWIDTRRKQPPGCLVSGPSAFDWYLWTAAQCERSLAALESSIQKSHRPTVLLAARSRKGLPSR